MRKGTNGQVYYLLADQLGSTSAVVDPATDAVIASRKYWPYGGERAISGDARLTSHWFTGQRDEDFDGLGLYNYNARFYSTLAGRFLSADPAAAQPGEVHGRTRVLTYAYAHDNPLRFDDPSGQCVPGVDDYGPCKEQCVPCDELVALGRAAHLRPDLDWEAIAACGGGLSCFKEVTGIDYQTSRWPILNGVRARLNETERLLQHQLVAGITVYDLLTLPVPEARLTSTIEVGRTLDRVLRPGGHAVGNPGRSVEVRTVQSEEEMWQIFGELAQGGKIVDSAYPGVLVELPSGGVVGIREGSASGGLTVDIQVPGEPIKKIHLQERR